MDNISVEFRRRDVVGAICPVCFSGALQPPTYGNTAGEAACSACGAKLPRYLTKREFMSYMQEEPEDDSAVSEG